MKIKTIFSLIGVLAVVAGLFVWFGVYNIAATEEHWPLTTELLEVVRERSVQVRSEDIVIPETISPELISKGAENYEAMCAQCHLAPGYSPTEIHRGLYPQPPIFHNPKHEAHNKSANFWVIKNGIKLTGMPSWGSSHSDDEIWGLVAFITKLPGMTVEDYKQITGSGEKMMDDHHSGGNGQQNH